MGRAVLTGLLGLALAACDKPAAPPVAPPAAPVAQWAFGLGENSVEMAWLTDPAKAEAALRLVCARGDGVMVEAAAFKPIGSEERLSIGAGDTVQALVAVVATSSKGPLVRATGPVEEPFLTALESGQPLAASYGAQTVGPIEAPPAAMRRAFAETCRKLNGGTHA